MGTLKLTASISLMFRFMSKEHVPNSLTIQGLGLSAFTA